MAQTRAPLSTLIVTTVVCALTGLSTSGEAQSPVQKNRTGVDASALLGKWTGDLDGMKERRIIRVLTAYSRTLFFIDRGAERGTAADQGRLLEAELNKTLADGHLKVNLILVPV